MADHRTLVPEPRSGETGEATFTLLGPLRMIRDGRDRAPTAPKELQLAGLLLSSPGGVVHVDSIIEELWGDRPPRSVRSTMQTHVYHLRQAVERNMLTSRGDQLIATRPPGYSLAVSPTQVDVFDFELRCRRGRVELDRGQWESAAETFRSALDLWSGPALANVACGPVLSRFVIDLEERRRNARHLRIEADIARGAHRELVGELRALTAADHLDEGLHGQLIRVLARSGRRSDAMAIYRGLRSRLVEELGIEPSAELQELHHELLSVAGRPLPDAS